MDEVLLTIKGERQYLWRAVDQDGTILDILVQRRRDKKAAKKVFRQLLKGLMDVPRVLITDKLQSYGAAKREILPGVEASIGISTIGRRIPTSPPVNGSNACSGSNPQARRNDSSLPMGPSRSTSARTDIGGPRPHTVKS